jgi:hypothetical protein
MISHTLNSDVMRLDVSLHLSTSTAPSDSDALETSNLKRLILERNVAALMQFQPKNLPAVAQLCFEMVETYPAEVMVVLWREEVAEQAETLLWQTGREPRSGVEARTEVALARAILDAGHLMAGEHETWPADVLALLKERYKASRKYWASKAEKFSRRPYKHGVKTFSAVGSPFYSFSYCKLAENLNGGLHEDGQPFVCCHLALAVENDTKNFLKSVRLRDVSALGLNYAALEQRHRDAKHMGGRSSVQFSLEKFGQLLVRMIPLVPQGETRSFPVSYAVNRKLASGHAMRVFLKKASSGSTAPLAHDPMELKVSLYDPNVTGDMIHLRVLPEDLGRLTFQSFGCPDMVDEWGVDVLSMDVGDPALARALAGQFIAHEGEAQISSFLCALGYGNLHEMRVATSALLALGALELGKLDGPRSGELAQAFFLALLNGHADAVRELAGSPLLAALGPETLKKMVLGMDPRRVSGWLRAVQRGHQAVIEASGELLAKLEPQLNDDALKQVLRAWATGWAEALRLGLEEVVTACGGVLDRLQHRARPEMLKGLVEPQHFGRLPGWAGSLLLDVPMAPQAWRSVLETLQRHQQLGLGVVRRHVFGQNEQGVPRLRQALESDRGDIVHFMAQVILGSRLPSDELDPLLDPGLDGLAIRQAIGLWKRLGLRAYLEMVVAIQESDYRLNHGHAWSLLKKIRHAHGKRLPWYLGCLWVNSPEYRRMIRWDKAMGDLFVKVERLLRSS